MWQGVSRSAGPGSAMTLAVSGSGKVGGLAEFEIDTEAMNSDSEERRHGAHPSDAHQWHWALLGRQKQELP